MSSDVSSRDLAELMADAAAWRELGREWRTQYSAAEPWPHIVVDDLFPRQLVQLAEEQELPRALGLVPLRSHQEAKGASPHVVGPAATALLAAMCTPAFTGLVTELTQVPGLVPDPTHTLSGLHVSGPGAFQTVHRDFFRHPVTNLWHRVNVLVYLNSDWPEEFGGHLELWPPDMQACGRRVLPTAGRVAIFETRFDTLHGVPDPVRCDAGRARLSLASYYYSRHRPLGRVHDPIFRHPRRPQDPWRIGVARPGHIALGVIHPLYVRVPLVKRVVNRFRADL